MIPAIFAMHDPNLRGFSSLQRREWSQHLLALAFRVIPSIDAGGSARGDPRRPDLAWPRRLLTQPSRGQRAFVEQLANGPDRRSQRQQPDGEVADHGKKAALSEHQLCKLARIVLRRLDARPLCALVGAQRLSDAVAGDI